MADAYTGEIRLFARAVPPAGWHNCDGTILPVGSYQALFALIGAVYGGNGSSTFALPDLRGRVPVGQGTGVAPNTTNRVLGSAYGTETVTLTTAQMPAHTHALQCTSATASTTNPSNAYLAVVPPGTNHNALYFNPNSTGGSTPMTMSNVSPMVACQVTGGSAPHDNMMPSLVLNYIICLNGTFPTRP